MKKFKLDDSVLHRVVQIVQEAFLTGVDCADIMRQIELTTADDTTLVLSDDYKALVARQHESMLQFAQEMAQKDSEG